MKYIDYKEHRQHGTFHFPIAYYRENPRTPRYLMQYHWHPEYEIIRIISGTFQLTVNNSPVLCRENDIIFLSDGFLHGGVPHNCFYDGIIFDFPFLLKDNHACAKTIQDIVDHKYIIRTRISDYSPHVLPIVTDMCAALASRQTGYEFLVQGYLYQLLGVILAERLYDENSDTVASSARLNSMKAVLALISESYADSLTLDRLAAAAGMNPKYFCRYFHNMTGRTPIDYLNYYRIECACEMLATRSITVKEAAFSCGYNDESYFIKTFHKYKGVTPKQYMTAQFQSLRTPV